MSPRRSRTSPRATVDRGRFVVVASGYADGPSQPLIRYLDDHGADSVTVITHPLVPEGANEHWVDTHRGGKMVGRSIRRRPHRPPFTYPLDLFTPLRVPVADVWIGFNCLATAQGLVARRLGRVSRVVHWNVDFAPRRFGASAVTRAYEWLDRRCVVLADARVELSDAARVGRLEAYDLSADKHDAEVVPMGSWIDESPRTAIDRLTDPRLVFLGHLVERMGVPLVVDLAVELRQRGRPICIDVVGGGPMLETLRDMARRRGVDELVEFHGFIEHFADVQQLLARAVIGLAPYDTGDESFSRFADPGKLKAYLGAALPVLLTDVPPNATELAAEGGAEVLPSDVGAFADAVVRVLDDRDEWRRRHELAAQYAVRFDWGTMLGAALPRLGIDLTR